MPQHMFENRTINPMQYISYRTTTRRISIAFRATGDEGQEVAEHLAEIEGIRPLDHTLQHEAIPCTQNLRFRVEDDADHNTALKAVIGRLATTGWRLIRGDELSAVYRTFELEPEINPGTNPGTDMGEQTPPR